MPASHSEEKPSLLAPWKRVRFPANRRAAALAGGLAGTLLLAGFVILSLSSPLSAFAGLVYIVLAVLASLSAVAAILFLSPLQYLKSFGSIRSGVGQANRPEIGRLKPVGILLRVVQDHVVSGEELGLLCIREGRLEFEGVRTRISVPNYHIQTQQGVVTSHYNGEFIDLRLNNMSVAEVHLVPLHPDRSNLLKVLQEEWSHSKEQSDRPVVLPSLLWQPARASLLQSRTLAFLGGIALLMLVLQALPLLPLILQRLAAMLQHGQGLGEVLRMFMPLLMGAGIVFAFFRLVQSSLKANEAHLRKRRLLESQKMSERGIADALANVAEVEGDIMPGAVHLRNGP